MWAIYIHGVLAIHGLTIDEMYNVVAIFNVEFPGIVTVLAY